MDRRGFCITAALGVLSGLPAVANAKPASTWFFDEKIEEVYEPAQQATDGRLDLNSAFVVRNINMKCVGTTPGVSRLSNECLHSLHSLSLQKGDYKYLPGMFPHAAGKLASNGPYMKVSDIYKIPGLTDNDKQLFKKYEKFFTANPPGRAFDERINARVST